MEGITLWFTGLSCPGKTTIAKALEKSFLNVGLSPRSERVYVITV